MTETNLISRQAAIDAMAELQGKASTKAELKGISKAWKRIKRLPSAQPDIARDIATIIENEKDMRVILSGAERKTGEWIEYIPEHGECPFCGNHVDLLNGKANNFCGECGADMRGKQDE